MENIYEVIMIDDDQDDIEMMQDAFREIGKEHLFKSFNSSNQLLDHLNETTEDSTYSSLLLLDHNLGRETGEDVISKISGHPGFEKLTLVLFSTLLTNDQVKRLEARGAVLCLTKPDTFPRFVQVAKQLTQIIEKKDNN
jgi:CheY-like chemotaxis protein